MLAEILGWIATTLEQSKKLLELGIDINTADMSYRPYREEGGIPDYQLDLCPYMYASWVGYPAWSLSALLNVLPYPQLSKDKLGSGKEGWMVTPQANSLTWCVLLRLFFSLIP